MVVNVVIPMAGRGQRFIDAGYTTPKPFLPLGRLSMIEGVTLNVTPQRYLSRVHWLVRREHFPMAIALAAGGGVALVPVPDFTEGAACTVLAGLASSGVRPDDPLLIANADQLVDVAIDDFIDFALASDGCLMTFPNRNPKWSYVRLDGRDQRVAEVAEKNPLSEHATVGIYFYRHTQAFMTAAETMLRHDMRVNGEFYVAPTFNELILDGLTVRHYPIAAERMHGLGTPEEYEAFRGV
jgi:NDP-sugar pyrophosphorylase family protein